MSTSAQFEWQVVEEEAEWDALSRVQALPQPRPQRWRSPWLWAWVGLLLLTTGGGVYALEHSAQAGWLQIERELEDAVAAGAWQSQPVQASAVPAVQLVAAEVHGSQAMVQAIVTQTSPSGTPVAYQTTDFYRSSEAGWVRTPPGEEQLGPRQTLATAYFEIHYYEVDTAVVQAIAPRLDALFRQASASFGLALPAQAQPILVELSMDPHNSLGWHLRGGGELIAVPSPLLLPLPAEQPASEWVYQALAEAVVTAVLAHATPLVTEGAGARINRWRPLVDALRLWQVWQAGGALAHERAQVIRQFHGAPPTPATFAACRTAPLWQKVVTVVNRLCRELASADPAVKTTGEHARPPRRLQTMLIMDHSEQQATPQWGETVALETLVEYAVATYGVERLPALLRATGRYTSWDGLLGAAFGVSAEQFEQGWNAYVDQHYARRSYPDLERTSLD